MGEKSGEGHLLMEWLKCAWNNFLGDNLGPYMQTTHMWDRTRAGVATFVPRKIYSRYHNIFSQKNRLGQQEL